MHEEPETWNIAYGHIKLFFENKKQKSIFFHEKRYTPLKVFRKAPCQIWLTITPYCKNWDGFNDKNAKDATTAYWKKVDVIKLAREIFVSKSHYS